MMTTINFCQMFVVRPEDKLYLIYFRDKYTTISRIKASPQPLNNIVFADLNDEIGETSVKVLCPIGKGRREEVASFYSNWGKISKINRQQSLGSPPFRFRSPEKNSKLRSLAVNLNYGHFRRVI